MAALYLSSVLWANQRAGIQGTVCSAYRKRDSGRSTDAMLVCLFGQMSALSGEWNLGEDFTDFPTLLPGGFVIECKLYIPQPENRISRAEKKPSGVWVWISPQSSYRSTRSPFLSFPQPFPSQVQLTCRIRRNPSDLIPVTWVIEILRSSRRRGQDGHWVREEAPNPQVQLSSEKKYIYKFTLWSWKCGG